MVIALSLSSIPPANTPPPFCIHGYWLYDWSRYKHRKITSIHGICLPLGIRTPFLHTTRFTWLFAIQWRNRFSFIHPLSAIHLFTKQYFFFEAFIETLHLPPTHRRIPSTWPAVTGDGGKFLKHTPNVSRKQQLTAVPTGTYVPIPGQSTVAPSRCTKSLSLTENPEFSFQEHHTITVLWSIFCRKNYKPTATAHRRIM